MYSDWTSLGPEMQNEKNLKSPLDNMDYSTKKNIVESLVGNGMKRGFYDYPKTEEELDWIMGVFHCGLSMSKDDHFLIKECVNFYCDWMNCLTYKTISPPSDRLFIPPPMLEDPNKYFCIMLSHLIKLFLPRHESSLDFIKQHVNLCNKILARLQSIVSKSTSIPFQTWTHTLKFLLICSDSALIFPFSDKKSFSFHICNTLLKVLFECWLLSCSHNCFPSPTMWKTLYELCEGWRHMPPLVDQWSRVTCSLTTRLISILYNISFSQLPFNDENLLPTCMNNETVVQCWFRFLHLLGNPAELGKPLVICGTQRFLHAVLASPEVVEPHQAECLKQLPDVFLKAFSSVEFIAKAFLAQNHKTPMADEWMQKMLGSSKDIFVSFSSFNNNGSSQFMLKDSSIGNFSEILSPFRPRVNSILHLLGSWLFEATMVGVSPQDTDNVLEPEDQWQKNFEMGRAEAYGTLCYIFCSLKSSESIIPIYLARFYTVLCNELTVKNVENSDDISPVLIKIFLNSNDLFKLPLIGCQVLVTYFINSIECLINKFKYKAEKSEELLVRKSCLLILLSILPMPLFYKTLPIRDLLGGSPTTFLSLEPRLIKLLLEMLKREQDSENCQIILDGLCTLIGDLCENYEQVEQAPDLLLKCYQNLINILSTRLLENWSGSLSCSLFCFEAFQFLSTFPLLTKGHSIQNKRTEEDEMKELREGVLEKCARRVVEVICEFVVVQCSKPILSHSKDLHSSIVSAFHCLKSFLVPHHHLIKAPQLLFNLMQVVELGISGTKSHISSKETPKVEKELKPVSLRVRDAAETLLNVIIDHVGTFPKLNGHSSLCTLLDENSFLNEVKSSLPFSSSPSFQYFVLDNSILLSLMEPPHHDNTPQLIVIMRSCFGRRVWFLKMKIKEEKEKLKSSNKLKETSINVVNSDQPSSMSHHGSPSSYSAFPTQPNNQNKLKFVDFFSESFIPESTVLADLSIPKIEETMLEENEDLEKLRRVCEEQWKWEEDTFAHYQTNYKPCLPAKPPKPPRTISASRLFLSHFGCLSMDKLKATNDRPHPSLIKLDNKSDSFHGDLKKLDRLPLRSYDNVYIFYVKKGQSKASDILKNTDPSELLEPLFLSFVLSLGWPVSIATHPGWTGDPKTSWKVSYLSEESSCQSISGKNEFNGKEKILYWSNINSEIAFFIASPQSLNISSLTSVHHSINFQEHQKAQQVQQDLLKQRKSGKTFSHSQVDFHLLIVWIESFQDIQQFPSAELLNLISMKESSLSSPSSFSSLPVCNSHIIFLHPLKSGLIRVHIQSDQTRLGKASPLSNEMLANPKCLGTMVRHTAVNVLRRKALDNDSNPPFHVRRKQLIKELIQKYEKQMTETDFYTSLFQ